jgi:N-acetylmuramoyl-L-alanine amidase CwlA
MTLELYRRHNASCLTALERRLGKPSLTEGFLASYNYCACRIWMRGVDRSGKYVREACKTRDWGRAQTVAHKRYEGRTSQTALPPAPSIQQQLDQIKQMLERIEQRLNGGNLNAAKPL